MSYFEKLSHQVKQYAEDLTPVTVHGIEFHVAKVEASRVESMQAAVVGKNGKVDVAKMKGFRARYLAACLRDPEDLEARLQANDINAWPNDLITTLFKEAKLANGEDLEEAEKNLPEIDD